MREIKRFEESIRAKIIEVNHGDGAALSDKNTLDTSQAYIIITCCHVIFHRVLYCDFGLRVWLGLFLAVSFPCSVKIFGIYTVQIDRMQLTDISHLRHFLFKRTRINYTSVHKLSAGVVQSISALLC